MSAAGGRGGRSPRAVRLRPPPATRSPRCLFTTLSLPMMMMTMMRNRITHSRPSTHPQVLLGDSVGGLYVCDFGGDVVVQRVGQTSVASALAYLDSGVVFVGSGLGDSMLVRLQSGEDGLEVLDTMANLGPIVDFACGDQGLLVCGGGGVKQVRGRCPCRRRCPCCPCCPCRRWGGPEDGAEDHCASSSVETG